MSNQEYEIYMEKCKVPEDMKPTVRKYKHCFSSRLSEIGAIKTDPPSEFTLRLMKNWDGIPYFTQPYKQTPEEQEAIDNYVKEQLEAGKIEPVKDLTGWNHSCTVAKKKDNEITEEIKRLKVCIDYGLIW